MPESSGITGKFPPIPPIHPASLGFTHLAHYSQIREKYMKNRNAWETSPPFPYSHSEFTSLSVFSPRRNVPVYITFALIPSNPRRRKRAHRRERKKNWDINFIQRIGSCSHRIAEKQGESSHYIASQGKARSGRDKRRTPVMNFNSHPPIPPTPSSIAEIQLSIKGFLYLLTPAHCGRDDDVRGQKCTIRVSGT